MNNGSGKGNWLVIIIVIIAIIMGVASCSGGGSSSKSTPWGKLGVSKNEYESVYNHYKYGTPIK